MKRDVVVKRSQYYKKLPNKIKHAKKKKQTHALATKNKLPSIAEHTHQ